MARTHLPAAAGVGEVPLPPGAGVWRMGRYVAVLAAPGGAAANALPFPYLCVDGESLLPCYGGQYGDGPSKLALPYAYRPDGHCYCFGDRLRYRLEGSTLIGQSSLARHVRRFEFAGTGFVCRDEIVFLRRAHFRQFAPANFLFRNLRPLENGRFETRVGRARASIERRPAGEIVPAAGRTASGELTALRWIVPDLTTSPGQRISTEIRVTF